MFINVVTFAVFIYMEGGWHGDKVIHTFHLYNYT